MMYLYKITSQILDPNYSCALDSANEFFASYIRHDEKIVVAFSDENSFATVTDEVFSKWSIQRRIAFLVHEGVIYKSVKCLSCQ